MADPKAKGGLALIFGSPKKKPGLTGGGSDLQETRELLKDASGWDDDTIDALHEYIKTCVSQHDEPDMDDMGGMGDEEAS